MKFVLSALVLAMCAFAIAAGPAPARADIVVATCGAATYAQGEGRTPTMDTAGNSCVSPSSAGGGATTAAGSADGVSAAPVGQVGNARNFVFNGATWDRMRGDTTNGVLMNEGPNTGVSSAAVTGGQVIKASAGNLSDFNVTTGATPGYVLIFNSTTVPADGAVTPTRCYVVGANSSVGALFDPPLAFSTGISIAFSSTGCFSKTASATAFIAGGFR